MLTVEEALGMTVAFPFLAIARPDPGPERGKPQRESIFDAASHDPADVR